MEGRLGFHGLGEPPGAMEPVNHIPLEVGDEELQLVGHVHIRHLGS